MEPNETVENRGETVEYRVKIDKKAIGKATETLRKYKDAKKALEDRIVEEERWWKLRHWEMIRGKSSAQMQGQEERPEPTSAWMFNSIANKHADVMDNFPEPNVLPRARDDEQDADTLSAVLPVLLERGDYEHTYSRAAWYKLKHGLSAKGVFWNRELENGLGDVDVRFVDVLNLFWEPGITDLQDSRNLFITSLQDNDLLEEQYPQLKGKLGGQLIDVKQYVYDDAVDTTDKSVVVDWYYKRSAGLGRTVLHYCKFVGSEVLFSSEDTPGYEDGFYRHGKYPVVLDVLYPDEGTVTGFGYVAITKSPELYIDKLNQVVLENCMMAAKPRFLAKNSAAVNEEELLDWSKPLVHFEGDPNNIQPIQVQPVGTNILNMLQLKIDELKETSSNRDVSQGSSAGGVTAAAAIAALQEAGNKISRDAISGSYRSYTQECYLVLELIRQFYDEARTFRITGDGGRNEYVAYSNANIRGRALPEAYPGQSMEAGYLETVRLPVFDIVVKPQKRSPYSKMSQNELAKELYQMGFFNPELAEQSLMALDMMEFDGKQKLRDQVQQGQTLLRQLQAMQQTISQMNAVIQTMSGRDIMGEMGGQSAAQPTPNASGGSGGQTMAGAQKAAQTATMTDYGQRLAAQARPDMNGGGA